MAQGVTPDSKTLQKYFAAGAIGRMAAQVLGRRSSGELPAPAMGYGQHQIEELEQTIARTPCDIVLTATPTDLPDLELAGAPVRY